MVKILANTSKIPAMEERLSNLADTFEQTAEGASSLSTSSVPPENLLCYADEKKEKMLAKLSAPDMASRHKENSGQRIDGTGDWIISHKTYEKWKRSTSSLLWLSGSGKFHGTNNLYMRNSIFGQS